MKTIKVDTNRGDKHFPMTSLDITKEVSRQLFRRIQGLKADVHNPELTLHLDVRFEGISSSERLISLNVYMSEIIVLK